MRILTPSTALILLLSSAHAGADPNVTVTERELANGNTLETARVVAHNDDGSVAGARGYRVTDADGNLVRRGHQRGYRDADGNSDRVSRRVAVREDGSQRVSRARVQRDADGSRRVNRQRRVR